MTGLPLGGSTIRFPLGNVRPVPDQFSGRAPCSAWQYTFERRSVSPAPPPPKKNIFGPVFAFWHQKNRRFFSATSG